MYNKAKHGTHGCWRYISTKRVGNYTKIRTKRQRKEKLHLASIDVANRSSNQGQDLAIFSLDPFDTFALDFILETNRPFEKNCRRLN